MKDVLRAARQLYAENPNITIGEMLRKLHISGYDMSRAVFATHSVLQSKLDDLCKYALEEYKQPIAAKEVLKAALTACDFKENEVNKAIEKYYPDTGFYAAIVNASQHARPFCAAHGAYNVGRGDFTVEGWISSTTGGGTIISRKGTEGGYRNGGFLLVLKPEGVIKFATDDGIGFYEVNSEAVNAYDGNFHHVLALRRGEDLEIYFDYKKIPAKVRTNHCPGLDVNNNLGITIGATQQVQEPYNYFNGRIGECRMWKTAKTYADKTEWINTDYIDSNLIAMWSFRSKSGEDFSLIGNNLNLNGCDIG